MSASVPHALVLGGNFAGLTAALTLKATLGEEVRVTVASPSPHFLFTPSLIWVPFGKRQVEDLTFPLAPTFEHHGVEFLERAAVEILPEEHAVLLEDDRRVAYDYLVVATGYRNELHAVPGIGPHGHAATITTAADARHAATGWTQLLEDPGDVVIGATPGAGCFGAAYEFLFNTAYQLRRHGLAKRVRLTYVTAEPFLGHFGIGGLPHGEQLLGMFCRRNRIETVTNAAIKEVDDGVVRLEDGRALPFRWSMVIPAFRGQDVVAAVPGLSDDKGFVRVRPTYQSEKYDDVYAVGVAAAVAVPWTTPVPVGVPKTGFPTEQQARTAAANIAAQVRGETPTAAKPFGEIPAVCVMDAGNNGVVILADRMLPPRKHGVLIPGPQAHAFKLAFERYFLWKNQHGFVDLP